MGPRHDIGTKAKQPRKPSYMSRIGQMPPEFDDDDYAQAFGMSSKTLQSKKQQWQRPQGSTFSNAQEVPPSAPKRPKASAAAAAAMGSDTPVDSRQPRPKWEARSMPRRFSKPQSAPEPEEN